MFVLISVHAGKSSSGLIPVVKITTDKLSSQFVAYLHWLRLSYINAERTVGIRRDSQDMASNFEGHLVCYSQSYWRWNCGMTWS
jgi:hypothetical protein